MCIAGLIERGRLSFDTPLSQALARTMARVGQPADPRLSAVTISQLLAHRAGLDKKDIANAPLADYLRTHTARRTAFDVQLGWIFRHRLASQPGTRYVYSNAGYLILGAVIEEASGRDYEGYCRETVLLPLGARDAELDPAWRIMSSYGGWRMPTADYGRFYQAFALGNPAIGPQARAWMMSPDGKRVVRRRALRARHLRASDRDRRRQLLALGRLDLQSARRLRRHAERVLFGFRRTPGCDRHQHGGARRTPAEQGRRAGRAGPDPGWGCRSGQELAQRLSSCGEPSLRVWTYLPSAPAWARLSMSG